MQPVNVFEEMIQPTNTLLQNVLGIKYNLVFSLWMVHFLICQNNFGWEMVVGLI